MKKDVKGVLSNISQEKTDKIEDKKDYRTLRIPGRIVNEVKKFINNSKLNVKGYRSHSEFIIAAIRDKIEKEISFYYKLNKAYENHAANGSRCLKCKKLLNNTPEIPLCDSCIALSYQRIYCQNNKKVKF